MLAAACYGCASAMIDDMPKDRPQPVRFERRLCRFLFSTILGCTLTASAWAATTFNSVYISEFLAANQHTLPDNDGEYSGWIELYNAGADTVNLAGWFLSDTPTNLTKWSFPGVGILPGNFLVIFASGKARTNDLAHLHTNFQLAKDGGYLALSGPATN